MKGWADYKTRTQGWHLWGDNLRVCVNGSDGELKGEPDNGWRRSRVALAQIRLCHLKVTYFLWPLPCPIYKRGLIKSIPIFWRFLKYIYLHHLKQGLTHRVILAILIIIVMQLSAFYPLLPLTSLLVLPCKFRLYRLFYWMPFGRPRESWTIDVGLGLKPKVRSRIWHEWSMTLHGARARYPLKRRSK